MAASSGPHVRRSVARVRHLPESLRPAFPVEALAEPLLTSVLDFVSAYRAFDRSDADGPRRIRKPAKWVESYADLLLAHQMLRSDLTHDAPHAQAVQVWSNGLAIPPCRQALAFWKPIAGLSQTFAALQPKAYEAREKHALAEHAFWSVFPFGHPLKDAHGAEFESRMQAMEEAERPWFLMRKTILNEPACTEGDQTLKRRMVESLVTDNMIDAPYLKSVLPAWKPYEVWQELDRCALYCRDCEVLLGPRPQDQSETDDQCVA